MYHKSITRDMSAVPELFSQMTCPAYVLLECYQEHVDKLDVLPQRFGKIINGLLIILIIVLILIPQTRCVNHREFLVI